MRIESMDAAIRTGVGLALPQEKNDVTFKPVTTSSSEHENSPGRVSEDFVKKAVSKANDAMRFHGSSLEFRIHEKTNKIMVKIIDSETKEVIREIPPEKMLDMFASMLEMAGLLVDERR